MQSNSNKLDTKMVNYIDQFLNILSDPIHKRIIQAYRTNQTCESMEDELKKIIREIIEDDN